MKKLNSSKWLAYAAIAYVFAFVLWWSLLLLRTENQRFENELKYLEIVDETGEPGESMRFEQAEKEHERNKRMIILEGLVFSAILLLAALFIMRTLVNQRRFIEQKNNFVLATSHELRSPVAALKLNLQTLLKPGVAGKNEILLKHNSLKEINRLQTLIENILLTSQLEAEQLVVNKESLNLTELVAQLINEYGTENERLVFDGGHNALVNADRPSMLIVVKNLIENALKYGGRESIVRVKIEQVGENVELSVSDSAPSIPPAERAHIWKKFYRSGNELSRGKKGSGLGLFLVKNMTELNNGLAGHSVKKGGGNIFTITLPSL